MRAILVLLLLTGVIAEARAQQHAHGNDYASMKARPIKALSDEQIGQLRDGKGMGLSLPAELNSYPGPVHVLEMQHALALTTTQQKQIAMIYDAMSAKAKALGAEIIAAESKLDRQFATASARPDDVAALLDEIAGLNGRLRAIHILAHMETRALLDPYQVARYDAERGYGRPVADPPQHKHQNSLHR